MSAIGRSFDVAVVGAGIVGLAHALAAARRGKRVVVIDRDARANGASIRNFGFITVTGQQRGRCWERAMLSRDVWREIAPAAGIPILHEGLVVAVRRPEALAVLESFAATDMGRDCRLLTASETAGRVPALRGDGVLGGLWSPHEVRVESREAIPRLADHLAARFDVAFLRSTLVKAVEPPLIETSAGPIRAEVAIVCPGIDFQTLFPERIAARRVTACKLHMMRIDPGRPAPALETALMSDLGLVRYLGYADLPEAEALKARLLADRPETLANGIHLIAVRSADGSLVVGDSHHYGETPDPFAPAAVDDLILEEFDALLDLPERRIAARWTGTYASEANSLMFVDAPRPDVRLVVITSGTGASTAFAIGEEVIADLFASRIPREMKPC